MNISAVRHSNRLPKEMMKSLSMEVSRKYEDVALGNMV